MPASETALESLPASTAVTALESLPDTNPETSASALPVSGVSQSQTGGQAGPENVVFVNIRNGALIVAGIAAFIILILIACSAFRNHARSKRRQAIMRHRRENRKEIIDFDRYTDPY